MRNGLPAAFLFSLLLISACAVKLDGLPGDPAQLKAEPHLFCPGDQVTVSWDARNMPRDESHCSVFGDAYSTAPSCASAAECPSDGRCVDGYCCPSDFPPGVAQVCPNHDGCYPPFAITVTADTLTLSPPVNGENETLADSRTVSPTASTRFTATLITEGETYDMSVATEMVQLSPPSTPVYDFPFVCNGATPGWQSIDLDREYGWRERRYASDSVQVIEVTNTSGHAIQLRTSDPAVGPITLGAGESTNAFNGRPRGEWFAALSPTDPASGLTPRCDATHISDPWPDLQVSVRLECTEPESD
ncbi:MULTISPECIES: hypothetical protein [Alcanivorax]|uniref:hypothetical protein n=1 Tax=Alcanivorax TaxID=59753 RepID=UPI0025C59D93|nr:MULTISPECIES: hypothetical protein [Alcanivorax]